MKEDLFRAVMLLDAADEALEMAALAERRKEAGKSLRNITCQERLKFVREFVRRVGPEVGYFDFEDQ